MGITLRQRVLSVLTDKPKTCVEIAKELGIKRSKWGYPGLSGTLCRLVKYDKVNRVDEFGVNGGYGYYV